MKTVAVILSGGSGSRFGGDLPKQYSKLAGRMVIEHTISVFNSHPRIDEVCVVANKKFVRLVEGIILDNNYSKVKRILEGGSERYQSSLAAINSYLLSHGRDVKLLIHDSVRPFVDHRVISECIEGLNSYNAIDVAIPCADTIIELDSDGFISNIPDRANLRSGQTPQAFILGTIYDAYMKALEDPKFKTTDDCGVVKKYLHGEPLFVVEGSNSNIKVTYKEDIYMADRLCQVRSLVQTHSSLCSEDVTLRNKVVVVFGGSYGIGAEIVKLATKLGAIAVSFSRKSTATDVSKLRDVESALAQAFNANGRIDAVINCAGVLIKEPLLNMTEECIKNIIDINLLGAINVSKASINYLTETHGSLLMFTSSSYTRGRALYSTYSATKAAVVNLTQALSEEWASKHVRVNCINPERTRTPMRVTNFGNEPKDTLLDPKDVANKTLEVILSSMNGAIVDVRLNDGS